MPFIRESVAVSLAMPHRVAMAGCRIKQSGVDMANPIKMLIAI